MDDKTEGTADELKGKARQAYGDVTDNPDQQSQGEAEEVKGHGKQAVGDVKNAVKDITGND